MQNNLSGSKGKIELVLEKKNVLRLTIKINDMGMLTSTPFNTDSKIKCMERLNLEIMWCLIFILMIAMDIQFVIQVSSQNILKNADQIWVWL